MLEQIRLAGYKSIRQMDLNLGRLNVLIGPNGAGKSNFISLFKLLANLVQRNLQLHVLQNGGAEKILHFGRRVTPKLLIELRWDDRSGYGCTLVPTNEGSLVIRAEECQAGSASHRLDFGDGRESAVPGAAESHSLPEIAARAMERLKSSRIYHFHDTSDLAAVKQLQDINDNRHLRADGANLAAFLYLLQNKHQDAYEQIVTTVRQAAPFFGEFILRPSPMNPRQIRLEWSQRGSDALFDAYALSDGTLRFIALATLLLQPREFMPATVLLDEPELGLHPYGLTLLASLLHKAAAVTQVMVATQSVTLVDQFAPEDLIVVDRVGEESVFRRLDSRAVAAWLQEYSLGQLWQKNLLGGQPHSDAAHRPGAPAAGPLASAGG